MILKERNLKSDLIWNYGSLLILGSGGLIMNFLIAKFYGTKILGIFNQVYAIYIVFSQIAVGGIHLSVLQAVAKNQENTTKRSQIIFSGVISALLLGAATSTIVFLSATTLGKVLHSYEVAMGIKLIAPALLLFALNKVLLNSINGLQFMKSFALIQASRYLSILAYLTWCIISKENANNLPLCFFYSEVLVFLLSIFFIIPGVEISKKPILSTWLRYHFLFGFKGFLSGMFMELNTRVDVLMIGYFLSDEKVGVYSLAAVVAEGLVQVLVVLRNNFNPMLAKLLSVKDTQGILILVRKSWKKIYPIMIIIFSLSSIAFYFTLNYLLESAHLPETLTIYAVLGLAIVLISGFTPFDAILIQGNRPSKHTLLMGLVVLTNVALNLLLIPVWGLLGAACATGLAYLCSVFYLNKLLKQEFQFSLLLRPNNF